MANFPSKNKCKWCENYIRGTRTTQFDSKQCRWRHTQTMYLLREKGKVTGKVWSLKYTREKEIDIPKLEDPYKTSNTEESGPQQI